MPKVGLRDVVPKDIHRVQVEFVWFIPRLVGHISKAINNVSDYIYSAVFVGHTPSFGGQFPVYLLEYIYILYIYIICSRLHPQYLSVNVVNSVINHPTNQPWLGVIENIIPVLGGSSQCHKPLDIGNGLWH